MNVLVVDDLHPNRLILSAVFKARGCTILEADCGETALALAAEHMPDLIILDMMMPGMSGVEVCETLKQSPALKHIPVVFVSANETPHDRKTAITAGSDGFVAKPVSDSDVDFALGQVAA